MASTTSRVCQLVASSTSRTRCAWVTKPVRLVMTPRASGRQWRGEQPGERGDQVSAAAVGNAGGRRFDLVRGADEAQLVPQPPHQGAGDGDRSLQTVDGPVAAQ